MILSHAGAELATLTQEELGPEVGITLGTRPSIVMMAPIIHECRRRGLPHFVMHTGQHYSPNMDAQFFTDLELPQPDHRLDGVAEKRTHGAQTAAMLEGIEKVLLKRKPRLLLVGGDANSNLAGALAARKLNIAVGHIESGERSYDWRMPEEHNRVMIDHISDHLFATNDRGAETLRREHVRGRIHVVGNPIVDASVRYGELARHRSTALRDIDIAPRGYALMTMHREENVDSPGNLRGALRGVSDAGEALGLRVVFLAHPRTRSRMAGFGLDGWAGSLPRLGIVEAVGYFDFMALLVNAALVFTDSGGVQQEACIHHVPCVTLRDNTEWVETLDIGANALAGCDPKRIAAAAAQALARSANWTMPFGGGDAASRIADVCELVIAPVMVDSCSGSRTSIHAVQGQGH